MIRYLLGDLEEEERIKVEERCFTDHDFFEQTLSAEEKLIDDYLAGALPPDVQRRFEEHFLASPQRRARVEFARSLQHKLAAPPLIFRRHVLIAAIAVLTIAVSAISTYALRLRRELTRLRADRAALHQQLSRALSPPTVSFVLTPGLVRDASTEARRLVIPPDSRVRLQLDLPAATPAYARYRIVLRTADGDEIWSQDLSSLVLDLPPGLLKPADYILLTHGLTTQNETHALSSHSFRVLGN